VVCDRKHGDAVGARKKGCAAWAGHGFATPASLRLVPDVSFETMQARPASPCGPEGAPSAASGWMAGGSAAALAVAAVLAARPRWRKGTAVPCAVVAQLRRSGQLAKGIVAQAVTISGVVGGEAEKNVNGEYVQAATLYNDKRHWQKKDDKDVWLLYIKKRWWVTDTADKDAEASSGWICSEVTEKRYPFDDHKWEVFTDEWAVQDSVKVVGSVEEEKKDSAPSKEAPKAAAESVVYTNPDGLLRFQADKAEATASEAPKASGTSVVYTTPDGKARFQAEKTAKAAAPASAPKKKGFLRSLWSKLRGKK